MDKKRLSSYILKTKLHFEFLDGSRGVAALAIVIFHIWNGFIQTITIILSDMAF